MYKKSTVKIFYIEYFIFLIYLIMILLEFKLFTIWPQITDLLVVNETSSNIITIGSLFISGHPHAFRVVLIFPFYVISEYLSINLEVFFSIVLLIILFLIYRINSFILSVAVPRKHIFYSLLFLLLLSTMMHGRIIFSILGNTLLLYLLYINFYCTKSFSLPKLLLLFILALWFSSVSSGTFSVFLLTIGIFYFLQMIVKIPYVSIKLLWVFSMFFMLLLFLSPILLKVIEKNLSFFGGSIIHMMSHGVGKYLIQYIYIVLPILLVLIILLPYFISAIKKFNILILPISMMVSSLMIGMFGLSSLLSGITSYIIFVYMIIYKKRFKALYV